jgi:prephenate dehydratase
MPKKPVIIGVSGAQGSFSEEAALTYAHKISLKKYSILYLVTVENVLAALEEGSITLGIFPIENSNGGIVIETVYAMAKHNFNIKKIFEIDIHMNLLAKKGTKIAAIKKIASHDQALKQCRFYLKRNWPKAKIEAYPDTAKAAQDLAEGKLPASVAVIASRRAAEIHKLNILEESIQDLKFNYTSFVVATK